MRCINTFYESIGLIVLGYFRFPNKTVYTGRLIWKQSTRRPYSTVQYVSNSSTPHSSVNSVKFTCGDRTVLFTGGNSSRGWIGNINSRIWILWERIPLERKTVRRKIEECGQFDKRYNRIPRCLLKFVSSNPLYLVSYRYLYYFFIFLFFLNFIFNFVFFSVPRIFWSVTWLPVHMRLLYVH